MRQGLIISAVGKDRPGIVDRISGLVFRENCNLEDSRMAILGGEFALIVLVTGEEESLGLLKAALGELESSLDLGIYLRDTRPREASAAPGKTLPYEITAVSMDHPGIVHRITSLLAQQSINVATLDTRVSQAPTTGTTVFSLTMEAEVPAEVSIAELRALLDRVANEENLDLDFRAVRI